MVIISYQLASCSLVSLHLSLSVFSSAGTLHCMIQFRKSGVSEEDEKAGKAVFPICDFSNIDVYTIQSIPLLNPTDDTPPVHFELCDC